MEILVASAIGMLTAVGVYLILRRESFPVILGLTFLSYAVNLFLFAMGRLVVNRPPHRVAGRSGLRRPVAAGPGAHRHRHLVRHDGAHRRAGAARLPGDRLGPRARGRASHGRRRTTRDAALDHWVIAPVIAPALTAAFLVLALRHSLRTQRIVVRSCRCWSGC